MTKLLKDSGIAADKDALKTLIEKMSGKKTHELVAEGKKQFASMPAGGAAPAGGASAAPAGGASAAPAKKEEKKEEPEEDLDMGDLFGY